MRSKNGRGIRTDFALDARDDGIEFLRNGMAGLLESQQFTGDFGVFDLPGGLPMQSLIETEGMCHRDAGRNGDAFLHGDTVLIRDRESK